MIQLNAEIAAIKSEMEGLFQQVMPFQEKLETVQSQFGSLLAENEAIQAEQELLLTQLRSRYNHPIETRLKVIQLECLVSYQRSIAKEVAREQTRAVTMSRTISQIEEKMTALQRKMKQLKKEKQCHNNSNNGNNNTSKDHGDDDDANSVQKTRGDHSSSNNNKMTRSIATSKTATPKTIVDGRRIR